MKQSLLYLVHRLPYPPNKGDKITSFNMLKYLSKRYDVYLCCFVDQAEDWQYVQVVKDYCKETFIVGLDSKKEKLLSLRGIFTGEALSIPYYRHSGMQQWVNKRINQITFDACLIFSGVMAQYVEGQLPTTTHTVLDLEDVDSDKWKLYAQNHAWPMNWVYKRESEYLLKYEKKMAQAFDATVLVSDKEAEFFKTLAPESANKVVGRVQGVDHQFFDPTQNLDNPYDSAAKVMVFVGAMDYWPNIDAAVWFSQSIFQKIKIIEPKAEFYIVGMNPTDDVKKLASIDGVTVTGSVDDVRPYIKHALFSVSPLRVARGIQNKVLEAMAMEKHIIATDNALTGIDFSDDYYPIKAEGVDEFVQRATEQLKANSQPNKKGRACVLEKYNWDINLTKIELLLKGQS